MRIASIIRRRCVSLFMRQRRDAELDRELSLHLQMLTRENMSAGMLESEARLAALREFGSVAVTQEACRDMRRLAWIEDLTRDVAYALRQLRKSPGFAFTAILSLALGIGANTAIFSLADAVLLRELPVRDAQQLVEITDRGGKPISYPLFRYVRERNDVFSGVLALSSDRVTARVRAGSREFGDMSLSPVSGDYFAVLGAKPVIGRALARVDMNAAATAVISYRTWKERFRGDPGVVGNAVVIGEKSYTVIGVAPPDFGGVVAGQPIDVWLPITWSGRRYLDRPDVFLFRVIARLRPGVSEKTAAADVQVLARQWVRDVKFAEPVPLELDSASGGLNMLRRRFARPLWALMGVVMLLLLCVAVNVANLLMVRAAKRRREIMIRLSIGAGRGRLMRQMMTESFVLAGLGGAFGLILAPAAAGSLVRFLSSGMGAMEATFAIDVRMLAFTIAVSCAVALLFGLAPALSASRLDGTPAFREGVSSRAGAPQANRSGALLVIGQVAISCILLSLAVLFARSLNHLAQADAGFESEHVLILSVAPGESGPRGAQAARVYARALDRLASVPGVWSASLSSEPLFGGHRWTEGIQAPAFHPVRGQDIGAVLLVISPHFFQTVGLHVISGRDFDARDNAGGPETAVVNESAASYFLGRRDAVGQSFYVTGYGRQLTVVGVVQDARYQSLREPPPPIVYLPYLQGPLEGAYLTIRTVGDPMKMVRTLWTEAHEAAPLLRYRGATTQDQLVDGTIAQDRMLAQLSAAFGVAGALLVLLGLFGVTAYEVSRRNAELGIRIALGAQRSSIIRLVVGRAVLLVGCGVLVGLTSAAGVMRLAQGLVYGVRAFDASNLLLPAMALLIIGAAAAYWPARRAASIDPVAAVREQ